MKKLSVRLAIASSLLLAFSLQAKPIRIDDGLAVGASGSWVSLDFTEGLPLSLGFDLAFLGGTADTIVINGVGGIELRAGSTALGSITAYGVPGSSGGSEWISTVLQPLEPVDGHAITDALRISWQSSDDNSQSQLALFTADNGDSFIEFNYWDGFDFDAGLNISESGADLGVIRNAGGIAQFDLRSYLDANDAACLTTWGAFDDNSFPPPDPTLPTPGTGCTAYFPDGDATTFSKLLPPSFQVANGGTAEDFNPVANYRFLIHYAAGSTLPPTEVSEPADLALLLVGLGLMIATLARRKPARA